MTTIINYITSIDFILAISPVASKGISTFVLPKYNKDAKKIFLYDILLNFSVIFLSNLIKMYQTCYDNNAGIGNKLLYLFKACKDSLILFAGTELSLGLADTFIPVVKRSGKPLKYVLWSVIYVLLYIANNMYNQTDINSLCTNASLYSDMMIIVVMLILFAVYILSKMRQFGTPLSSNSELTQHISNYPQNLSNKKEEYKLPQQYQPPPQQYQPPPQQYQPPPQQYQPPPQQYQPPPQQYQPPPQQYQQPQ
jgi:hypothetical protein